MNLINYITRILTVSWVIICLATISESQIRLQSVTVKSMGTEINSDGDESSPSVTDDAQVLVFHRRLKDSKNSDIYISRLIKGQWNSPEPIKEINSSENDETPYITPDGRTIYFSSNRKNIIESSKENSKDNTGDIYISHFVKGTWTLPEPLKGDVNTERNETAPSLSYDGQTLYYCQWPDGDMDKSRIMMATLFNGEFKYVREMPDPVNSDGSQYRLLPSKDKPGFYFASNRKNGYGSYDLYFAHYKAEKIVDIINLGSNINTQNIELSLAELDGSVIISSNVPGGKGGFDLYTIRLPQKITKLTATGFIVHLKDQATGEGVSIHVDVQLIPARNTRKEKKSSIMGSDLTGRIYIEAQDNYEKVILSYNGDEYKSFTREYAFSRGEMQGVTINLEKNLIQESSQETQPIIAKMEDKQKATIVTDFHPGFVFPQVFFALNSAELQIKYIPKLHLILDYLRLYGYIRIRIVGYADRRGEHYSNIELSLRRAIRVRDYFLSLGIDDSRLEVSGKGYSEPFFNHYGEEYDDYNRRVEFKIIQ